MTPRVLVVEDDEAIRELLLLHLSHAGFEVLPAADAESAWELVGDADAVVLDWMLPGQSGLEWLARLRRQESAESTPVLLLTARASEPDKVVGLDTGADDYLVKPFSSAELVARLRALLRRVRRQPLLAVGELRLDETEGSAKLAGESVVLTRREFDLLFFLAGNSGRVFSRTELLDRVWGKDFTGTERTVDQHVAQLRAALGPGWIETVRGRGYRFTVPA